MPLETPITETKANTCSMIVPHLPNEVLIAILSHLPLSRDLASAALVSLNFGALAQGFLYRSPQLKVGASEVEIQSYYSDGGKPHTFERFSRLIDRLSSNHELGHQTVVLSLTVPRGLWYTFGDHRRLMQCLPKLQHVTLRPPPLEFCIPSGIILSSVLLDFQLLSGHHKVETNVGNRNLLGERIAMTVFRHLEIPNLRKLQVENHNFQGDENFQVPWYDMSGHPPSGRCAVEDLRLIDCHDAPSGDFLKALLAKVEALRCFVFVSNSSSIFKGLREHRRPSMGGIARGLIRHMACVEEMVLSPSDGTYGAFLLREWFFDHCFTNLRSVALPNCLLVQDLVRRSQCLLPSTLREVQIQFTISADYYQEYDQADTAREEDIATVEWLAEAKLVSLPQLKRVIWWYQPCELNGQETYVGVGGNPFDGSLPELRRLRGRFSDVEVNFEWAYVRLFRDTPFGRRFNG